MCRPLHVSPCLLTRANNLSRNAFRGIFGTLAEKSPTKLPHRLPHCYSSRNQWLCLAEVLLDRAFRFSRITCFAASGGEVGRGVARTPRAPAGGLAALLHPAHFQ